MIIPVWKPLGASTHQLAKQVGAKVFKITNNPEDKKATHTGTLDPMAEGVVVVLTGEDRFKKSKHSNSIKTYAFEVLFGVQTDSLDILGLQTEVTHTMLDPENIEEKLQEALPDFVGTQKQTQPKFSSQRVFGKSAFDLAKNNTNFIPQINTITISQINLRKKLERSLTDIQSEIQTNIARVDGDFRQNKILENWDTTFKKLSAKNIPKLPVLKFEASVSKRTYIRALTRDISEKLQIPATTFSIIRKQNGIFVQDSCISLESSDSQILDHISQIQDLR